MMELLYEITALLVLALPIACISWTVVFEEVFREPHTYFVRRSRNSKTLFARKFFFLFTCEYCFSHYVTILFILLTDYKLLTDNWTGYVIGGFALVWIANLYMSLYALLRQSIKKEKVEIRLMEKEPAEKNKAASPFKAGTKREEEEAAEE